jgi:hypothetical protein
MQIGIVKHGANRTCLNVINLTWIITACRKLSTGYPQAGRKKFVSRLHGQCSGPLPSLKTCGRSLSHSPL